MHRTFFILKSSYEADVGSFYMHLLLSKSIIPDINNSKKSIVLFIVTIITGALMRLYFKVFP